MLLYMADMDQRVNTKLQEIRDAAGKICRNHTVLVRAYIRSRS